MFESSKLLREYLRNAKWEFCTEGMCEIFDNEKSDFVFAEEQEMLHGHGIISKKKSKVLILKQNLTPRLKCAYLCSQQVIYLSNFLCIWQ